MSNPHPNKQSHYGDAMSPRMRAKFAKYIPRARATNEATPSTINLMAQPPYVPEKRHEARDGENDASLCPSLGFGLAATYRRHP
jgi:hypothetical protein